MAKSLFQKDTPEDAKPTPYDLIEHEVKHLKKGTGTRRNPKDKTRTPPWIVILAFCGLAWLYLMDPIYHAWYKGEAVRAYLYLRNFGSAEDVAGLTASQILSPEDIESLNHRSGNYRDYYTSPADAKETALTIETYMKDVHLLHEGRYQGLDPVGRMRYAIFIDLGIFLPTQWPFLDPTVGP